MKSESNEPDEHTGSVHCCGRAGYSIRVSRQAIGDRNLRGHGTVADRLIRERLSSHPTAALQPSARSFSSTSFPSSSSSNPATSLFISLILLSGGLQIVVLPQQQILLNDVITLHQKFRCDTITVYKGSGMITIGTTTITMVMFPCSTSVTFFRGFIHANIIH